MDKLEPLAWGYGLIEGPRCDTGGNLYFSDVTNGGVYRRARTGEIETAIPKRRGVGGIALHRDGGLVVSGRNICHVIGGETRIVFAPEAPGLNDLLPDAMGRVLCATLRSNAFSTEERIPGECWSIGLDGDATVLYDGVTLANGIGFSPDGSTLYQSDTAANGIIAHDYDLNRGTVSGRRFFVQQAGFLPDGLAVDEEGNVWAADFGGSCVRVFDGGGAEVQRVEVPSTMVASLCFGGNDRRDLYIVTADNTAEPERGGTIFRTRVDVAGLAVAMAAV